MEGIGRLMCSCHTSYTAICLHIAHKLLVPRSYNACTKLVQPSYNAVKVMLACFGQQLVGTLQHRLDFNMVFKG